MVQTVNFSVAVIAVGHVTRSQDDAGVHRASLAPSVNNNKVSSSRRHQGASNSTHLQPRLLHVYVIISQ